MNKSKVVFGSILAVSLGGFGATGANAAVSCVTFPEFCDLVEVNTSAGNNNARHGQWDAHCGGDLHPVLGHRINGVITVGAEINDILPPAGSGSSLASFELKNNGLADLVGYDGVNPPFHFVQNTPYTISPGPCPFEPAVDADGRPALTD